jgi:hypothetical protein
VELGAGVELEVGLEPGVGLELEVAVGVVAVSAAIVPAPGQVQEA